MGIKNLSKLIQRFAPDSVEKLTNLSALSGMTVGIDVSIMLYQLRLVNAPFDNIIQGIFFRALKLITNNITPVFVFDGPPPKMKAATLAARNNRIEYKYDDIFTLLKLMGIAAIQAPSESEAQIAALIQRGKLHAAITEDYDCLVFGASKMIVGFDTSAKSLRLINRDKLLQGLNITNEQFIDLCILLGCDYTGTVPGIGYVRAYSLIKEKSIDKIAEGHNNINYEGARKIFNEPLVADVNITQPRPDLVKLFAFLVNRGGLSPARISNGLDKLALYYNTYKLHNLPDS